MATSVEQLKELIKNAGVEWKKTLSDYLKDEEVENSFLYSAFIDAYRDEVIDSDQKKMKETADLLDNDLLLSDLKEYVDGTLAAYYAADPLRVLARKDPELAVKLMDCVFKRWILRFDPELSREYKEYGFVSEDSFTDTLRMLDALMDFMVRKNFTKNAAAESVYLNIRMPKDLCMHMAELIDSHFDQLRMKLILDRLDENI